MTIPLAPLDLPTALHRLADQPQTTEVAVAFHPDADGLKAFAAALDIPQVKKLRLEGRLIPEAARDWRLEATLGATVVQPCNVTLAPVTTRIDEPLTRRYMADLPDPEPGEVEMPEDTDIEPLPEVIDLALIALEALALALPPFPRAPDADPGEMVFTEPGKVAMTDDDAKPFAALSALKNRLGSDDDTKT